MSSASVEPAGSDEPAELEVPARRWPAAPTWMAAGVALGFALARAIDAMPDGKLASLVGFGLVVACGWTALARPQLLPAVLVAYIPFNRAFPLSLGDVAGFNGTTLVIGLGLVAWLVSGTRRERRALIGFEMVLVLYLLLGLLGAVRGQLALGGIDVLDLVIEYRTWAAPILLFFVARGTVENAEDADAVLGMLAIVTFLIAALTWQEGVALQDRRSIEAQRVWGVMKQPNSMGAFLAYYGVPLLALAVSKGRWLKRGLFLGAFFVAARAMIFTYSRGALLALAAGSAAVIGLVSPLGLGVIGGVVAVGQAKPELLPNAVQARFAQTTEGDTEIYAESMESQLDDSSAKRLNLWRAGFAMMRDQPLVGVGLYNFSGVAELYAPVPLDEDDPTDAHNAFILTGAELGVPALALMLILLIWIAAAGLASRWRGRDPSERRFALAMVGCVTAVIVSCMFGSRFADEGLIGCFWLLAGTLFALRTRPEADEYGEEEEEEALPAAGHRSDRYAGSSTT